MTTEGLPSDGIRRRRRRLAGRLARRGDAAEPKVSMATITLVGEELHLPYDRPPLSKQVLAGTWPPEKAVLADRREAASCGCTRSSVIVPSGSTSKDARSRSTTAPSSAGTPSCWPRGPPRGTCREPRDSGSATDCSRCARSTTRWPCERAVTAVESCRVIVIGAGFIGAEVASTCAALGCRVTVIEAMEIPLSNVLGPLIGTHCGSLHAAHGVDLRTGVGVAGVRRVEGHRRADWSSRLEGGEVLEADVVVVGIGVVPAVELAARTLG